jgi:hypothetical protein
MRSEDIKPDIAGFEEATRANLSDGPITQAEIAAISKHLKMDFKDDGSFYSNFKKRMFLAEEDSTVRRTAYQYRNRVLEKALANTKASPELRKKIQEAIAKNKQGIADNQRSLWDKASWPLKLWGDIPGEPTGR